MQKARNDAIEAQQNRTVSLSASLDKVSSSIVSNAFKPMHTTATPTTVASTTSGPNVDPDWTSPVAVTSTSKPPVQPPTRRSFLRRKLYQTAITWGDRDSFADYMHDCYGGDKDFTLMPVIPLDKVKHPWNEELLLDLCKIRINCIARLDKDYVELWIRTIARGIGTSPVPYIKDKMSFPPDIVDDTQAHLDDTYVESLENVQSVPEVLVSEDPEYEDEGFYYDENVLE